ncbi:MAG: alanine racemase, partial [Planctomycetota bacterium]|nr:alanine racemase [Planctomycetota bacterium]
MERTDDRALRRNLACVRERIARARAEAGRVDPSCEIRLVAITKSVSPAIALALAEAGQADLGENRADELERKAAFFARHGATDSVRWHYVGHLQRNKARRVARIAATIHSVDSLVLVETLARIAGEEDARPGIYVQVHLSGEATKHGFAKNEVAGAVERVAGLGELPLLGLMTMAPLLRDPAASRVAAQAAFATFQRLAELARSLPAADFAGGAPQLSMGMSADFLEA